jgi:hypothetical protein
MRYGIQAAVFYMVRKHPRFQEKLSVDFRKVQETFSPRFRFDEMAVPRDVFSMEKITKNALYFPSHFKRGRTDGRPYGSQNMFRPGSILFYHTPYQFPTNILRRASPAAVGQAYHAADRICQNQWRAVGKLQSEGYAFLCGDEPVRIGNRCITGQSAAAFVLLSHFCYMAPMDLNGAHDFMGRNAHSAEKTLPVNPYGLCIITCLKTQVKGLEASPAYASPPRGHARLDSKSLKERERQKRHAMFIPYHSYRSNLFLSGPVRANLLIFTFIWIKSIF